MMVGIWITDASLMTSFEYLEGKNPMTLKNKKNMTANTAMPCMTKKGLKEKVVLPLRNTTSSFALSFTLFLYLIKLDKDKVNILFNNTGAVWVNWSDGIMAGFGVFTANCEKRGAGFWGLVCGAGLEITRWDFFDFIKNYGVVFKSK